MHSKFITKLLLFVAILSNFNAFAIFKGNSTANGRQFPFMASVYEERSRENCGGSYNQDSTGFRVFSLLPFIFCSTEKYTHFVGSATIINPKYVLTAAHVMRGISSKVLIGVGHNRKDKQNILQIRKYTICPVYTGASCDPCDLALIELKVPLIFNQNVAPIQISISNSNNNRISNSVKPILAGWGALDCEKEMPTVLQYAQPSLMPTSFCLHWVQERRSLLMQAQISVHNMNDYYCTRNVGRIGAMACDGDSGAPLFIRKDGHFVQYAVMSCSILRVDSNIDVYVNLKGHRWIEYEMKMDNKIDKYYI